MLNDSTSPHSARRGRSCAGVAGIAVALALGASGAFAATLKVEEDGAQCGAQAYTTIQAAVDAASPGSTIKVCPGTYAEQVTIDKTLKIKGKAPKVPDCATLPTPDPTLYSVVEAPPVTGVAGIGLDIFADRVSIKGLVVTHAGEVAIRTDPAYSGFSIKKSVLVANANGLYLHSNGATVRASSRATASSTTIRAGIRTRYGLANAKIMKNRFVGTLTGAAIILDQEPPVTNDQRHGQGQRIRRRLHVPGGGGHRRLARHQEYDRRHRRHGDLRRRQQRRPGDIPQHRDQRRDAGHPFQHGGVRRRRQHGGTGLAQHRPAGRHSRASPSIPSGGASSLLSSTIEDNVVTASGQSGTGDGIRIEDSSPGGANIGNTVRDNAISGSFNHDCHDDTTGGGTAGTGNTWESQAATTQNRAALCVVGPANGTPD